MKKITIIIEDGEMDITESPKCQYPVTKDKFYSSDSESDYSNPVDFKDIPGYAEMQKSPKCKYTIPGDCSYEFGGILTVKDIPGYSKISKNCYWIK